MAVLALPIVRHASSAGFVRQMATSMSTRPPAVIVRKGSSFKLLDIRDLMIAAGQAPLDPVGKLLSLRDCIATLSAKKVNPELIRSKVGGLGWAEWFLQSRRKLLLLTNIAGGIAHLECPYDAAYLGLAPKAPDCICPNRHEYFLADGVPDDRLCIHCRQPLTCMG